MASPSVQNVRPIEFTHAVSLEFEREIATVEALNFLAELEREFGARRRELLEARKKRQLDLAQGGKLNFLAETETVRTGTWSVASCPPDLLDRRVEITGPAEPKMTINALNSGAKVFMADIEDSLSPTWENVQLAQVTLKHAVRKTLRFRSPEGKEYSLKPELATLIVRPRGWHLEEKHALIHGAPASASLFDFGLYFFQNAKESLSRKSGPYFYLPKMESHLEARLWNDVFVYAQKRLSIPVGTIRATVLIETFPAAFEMDEILYELRDHASGLNAGRWDYIFSVIKKFAHSPDFLLPDRSQVTMTVPFMRAYTELLVQTCHRRNAHAMGGMAAFIPNRKDAALTEKALNKVREDKERESRDGFDGTWVAHPDLVPVAMERFDKVLGNAPHQKSRRRPDVQVSAEDLLNVKVPNSNVTLDGVRMNINVGLQYIERWLRGYGAAAIHNLMEDVATAEISRAQLWQWRHHGVKLESGAQFSKVFYEQIRNEELSLLKKNALSGRFDDAAKVLDELVLSERFIEFLTLPAYGFF